MQLSRTHDDDGFTTSRARFEEVVGFLAGAGAAGLDHGELDLRAAREQRLEAVVDTDGANRPAVEAGTEASRGSFDEATGALATATGASWANVRSKGWLTAP